MRIIIADDKSRVITSLDDLPNISAGLLDTLCKLICNVIKEVADGDKSNSDKLSNRTEHNHS